MPANTQGKSKTNEETASKKSFFERLFGIGTKKNVVEKNPAQNTQEPDIKQKTTSVKVRKTKTAATKKTKTTPKKTIDKPAANQETVITANLRWFGVVPLLVRSPLRAELRTSKWQSMWCLRNTQI